MPLLPAPFCSFSWHGGWILCLPDFLRVSHWITQQCCLAKELRGSSYLHLHGAGLCILHMCPWAPLLHAYLGTEPVSSCLWQRTFTDSLISTLFLIVTGSLSLCGPGRLQTSSTAPGCWHHRPVPPYPAKTSSLTLSGILLFAQMYFQWMHIHF